LLNYFGQWSVTALTFPPTARAFNDYVDSYPTVPLENHLASLMLHPPSSSKSYLIYPTFLLLGLVSLIMSIGLSALLWKPRLAVSLRVRNLMVAGFFATMCQTHTVIISLINVATPRFLMAVYPQILLTIVFLSMAAVPRLISTQRATTG